MTALRKPVECAVAFDREHVAAYLSALADDKHEPTEAEVEKRTLELWEAEMRLHPAMRSDYRAAARLFPRPRARGPTRRAARGGGESER